MGYGDFGQFEQFGQFNPYDQFSQFVMDAITGFFSDPMVMAVLSTIAVVVLGIFAGLMLFGLVMYILESRGLHKLAKDRQIRHGWLAWFPLGYDWILGSIADHYHYVAKGHIRGRRKTLLGLYLAIFVLVLVQIGCYVFYAAYMLNWFAIDFLVATQLYLVAELIRLAIAVLSLILMIHRYIALHDLYASCEPDGATAYLVISILLPVTEPFFVFSCRKKEYGMPPRKPVMSVPTTWQPPEIPTLDEE